MPASGCSKREQVLATALGTAVVCFVLFWGFRETANELGVAPTARGTASKAAVVPLSAAVRSPTRAVAAVAGAAAAANAASAANTSAATAASAANAAFAANAAIRPARTVPVASNTTCARIVPVVSAPLAPQEQFDFSTDCDGKPVVDDSGPNTVVDAMRTCRLPQYGTASCGGFLGDGDCDAGQYYAGVIEGKGKKRKKGLLRHSPSFNCSRFEFDRGDCSADNAAYPQAIPHRSPPPLPPAMGLPPAGGSAAVEAGAEAAAAAATWVRFRHAKVAMSVGGRPVPAVTANASNASTAWARCVTVSTAGGDNATAAEEHVQLHQPVSSRTGVRGKHLQFIYFKPLKTGSETTYTLLYNRIKGVCEEGKLTNIKELCDLGRPGHGSVRFKLRHLRGLGIMLEDVFTFSGVRNPWDRQVSWFFWDRFRGDKELRQNRSVALRHQFREHLATAGAMSFDEFLTGEDGGGREQFPGVNFVLKYERLDEDLARLLRLLGVEQTQGAGAPLADLAIERKKFRPTSQAYTVDRRYREYYDAASREAVRVANQKTIDLFGYSF